ncbi:hypothetical protein M438DRAFT_338163 [Aureobasidium pullulans EXF-150]|uniref:Concanavalin A-like lectin/glucanase n=1 Tax=Aureobasidium pullulans EXF-150 TaxID=1043002 RepID=A0A074X788_AURPU|nr:uncharacterized protein M438DRAFT_338163 [Aureobasidium pullulans EXF-150]KEQ81390.1 hypothetical protein M438DRAFT_338163 [Aureobasidium pullulans EXF-150]
MPLPKVALGFAKWLGPTLAAGAFNDEDLAGWSQGIEDAEPPDDLQNALTSLGIPFQEDDFQEMSWENNARTTKNGNSYPPSGAEYTNYMNAGSGIIISSNNYGPGSYDVPRNMWPPLWRFSDVTWLQWTRAANANVGNIKYWMRVTIANDDTLGIIAQLFGGDRLNVPQWPGETFLMSGDQGKALLGTPNAAGVCWFLAQHPEARK